MSVTPKRPKTAQTMTNDCIVCLSEGRSLNKQVGMAVFNTSSYQIMLAEFTDNATFVKASHQLALYNPSTVLMCNPNTSLYSYVSKRYRVALMNRSHYNESNGYSLLETYNSTSDSILFKKKYYALSSLAALLKYIESTVFYPNSILFQLIQLDGIVMMDSMTIQNLQLNDFIKSVNNTRTPMGTRMFRMNVFQPLVDLDIIKERQDAVDCLIPSSAIIQQSLTAMHDLDHILASLVREQTTDQTIHSILGLKKILLTEIPIQNAPSQLITHIKAALSPIKAILTLIDETVDSHCNFQRNAQAYKHSKVFCIKNGINGMLDVARQTYSELVDDCHALIENYATLFNLPFKLNYSKVNQFYISCSAAHSNELDPMFINVQKKKTIVTCSTMDLLKLNERMKQTENEIFSLSGDIIQLLLNEIHKHISSLYKLSEALGLLDMLTSFAAAAAKQRHTRPEFGDATHLIDSRHPILSRILMDVQPNDLLLDTSHSFGFVTGPNMSGKSTFAKQIILLQILSQIGSFVPCRKASFRISDCIFYHSCTENDFDLSLSTFLQEMVESANILRNATPSSLIVLDELGRGTGHHDAIGITAAICEQLIQSNTFTLFVTHFHELTEIVKDPRVFHVCFTMECLPDGSLFYDHRVKPVAPLPPHYGITLARRVLPTLIIDHAKNIVELIEFRKDSQLLESKILAILQSGKTDSEQWNEIKKLLH